MINGVVTDEDGLREKEKAKVALKNAKYARRMLLEKIIKDRNSKL
jgi:hypothetical protein